MTRVADGFAGRADSDHKRGRNASDPDKERPAPFALDWRRHPVSRRPRPCVLCGGPALMVDWRGHPCHKVCAEKYIRDTAETYGS